MDHNIDTPEETIVTSNLCSFLNQSMNSCSVGLPGTSNRSQMVHSVSPYYKPGQYSSDSGERGRRTLFLAAAIGSEKPKKGKARLTNPFLYCSRSFLPSMI